MRTERAIDQAQRERTYPWRIFWLLLAAAIVGVLAVLPYVFALFSGYIGARPLPMSMPAFVVTQLLQATIVFGVVIGLGLVLAPKVGIELPLLRNWVYGETAPVPPTPLRLPLLVGLLTGGAVVLLLYVVVLRVVPQWPLAAEAQVPVWKRLLACYYGAVNEELLVRLFLLSLVMWIALKAVRRTEAGSAIFWTANVIVAIIFGALHLPAAAAILPLTTAAIVSIVLINGTAGLVMGVLAWRRGIEAAMVAHFFADLTLHLVGPLFVRAS